MKFAFNSLKQILFFVFILTSALHAEPQDPIALKLVPGGPQGSHVLAGIALTIPSAWHVYAPSPENEETMGFDPTITWDTSTNVKAIKVLWPVPHKTKMQDQLAYVYEGNTLIPLEVTPIGGKAPITLNLKVSFLACASLCMPIEKTLSLVINPGDKGDAVFKAVEQRENAYEGLSLLAILGIALLGGLILNVMPCVLPVSL